MGACVRLCVCVFTCGHGFFSFTSSTESSIFQLIKGRKKNRNDRPKRSAIVDDADAITGSSGGGGGVPFLVSMRNVPPRV
uniref:Putative secreted protein n=1 Tax=Anopheles darlingi TaxID=43151 RepID=A0A2M4D6L3_ANODA